MDEETRILIEIRIDRSREDIETAKELLNLGRHRAAVNRAYYALFAITTALLLTQKIERSKQRVLNLRLFNILSKRALSKPNTAGSLIIFGKRERNQTIALE